MKKSPSRKSRSTSRKAPRAGRGTFKVKQKLYKGYPRKKYDKGKGPVPKHIKALTRKAGYYKKRGHHKESSVSRRLKEKEFIRKLERAGYTTPHAKEVYKQRVSSKIAHSAFAEIKIYKGRYKYKGKFISKQKARRVIWAYRYNRTIKHYRELYGLTQKEAQELWRGLRDENYGQQVFKALY